MLKIHIKKIIKYICDNNIDLTIKQNKKIIVYRF